MSVVICSRCGGEIPSGFKFCGHCGHNLSEAPTQQQPAAPMLGPERREVTVLFADISGFTAMCERLDPEDVHSVMNECFAGLGHAVQEEGGHIDKYIGDAVMVLFGAPVAHEDDPARACRAALGMQAFLRDYGERCQRQTGVAIRMRIGIHCGLVVAGQIGSEVHADYSVMGDTVNVASRLESTAPPGGVLISAEVARRTRGQFECGPPQFHTVKGRAQPVEACLLLRQLNEADKWGRDGGAVAFVGRDAELGLLQQHWQAARAHAARRWIEIRGPMGVGKTRLVEEAAQRRRSEHLLAVAATPRTMRAPFGLAREVVAAVLRRLTDDAAWSEDRDALTHMLRELDPALEPFADALWHLLAPSRLTGAAPDVDPQSLRRMLERGVVKLLEVLAARPPATTLFLDSFELADDASAHLFASLGVGARGWPLPVLVASRGERPVPGAATLIQLDGLDPTASAALLDQLARGAALPAELRQSIIDRGGGIPLHMQELVRTLIDDQVLTPSADGSTFTCNPDVRSVALPSTLRSAMVSRLDRLPRAERDLLCQCAVQGFEFRRDVAARVCARRGEQEVPVDSLLVALRRHGLVADASERGPGWVVFRQPLMHEACYETLLRRERRSLHRLTAAVLCDLAGGAEGVAPELLAHHYEGAEDWRAAATASVAAGDRAADLFLNPEALRWYERVLAAVDRVTEPDQRDQRWAGLARNGAAQVLLRLGRYAVAADHAKQVAGYNVTADIAAEAERLLAAVDVHIGHTDEAERSLASALARTERDRAARSISARVHYDMAELAHRGGRTDDALAHLRACRAAAGSGDQRMVLQCDMLEGTIAHTQGRFADAAAAFTRAFETSVRLGSSSHRARAANHLGNVARDHGDYDGAEQYFRRALDIWERIGDAECIAGARNNLGNLAMSRGELDDAEDHHRQSLAAFREIGNVRGLALAHVNLAILALERGDAERAVNLAERAVEQLGDSENALLRGPALVTLGEARLESGATAAATAAFREVLSSFDETTHPLAVAGAVRGLGRVALAEGDAREATDLSARALALFERLERAQEAARTALVRAEALRQLGQRDAARTEAEAARNRLVSIHATRDVARADALLQRLAAE